MENIGVLSRRYLIIFNSVMLVVLVSFMIYLVSMELSTDYPRFDDKLIAGLSVCSFGMIVALLGLVGGLKKNYIVLIVHGILQFVLIITNIVLLITTHSFWESYVHVQQPLRSAVNYLHTVFGVLKVLSALAAFVLSRYVILEKKIYDRFDVPVSKSSSVA